MGETETALVLNDGVDRAGVTAGQAPHYSPLVEIIDPDTAVRTAQQGQEGEELVDAGHGRHGLAALQAHSLWQWLKKTAWKKNQIVFLEKLKVVSIRVFKNLPLLSLY